MYISKRLGQGYNFARPEGGWLTVHKLAASLGETDDILDDTLTITDVYFSNTATNQYIHIFGNSMNNRSSTGQFK